MKICPTCKSAVFDDMTVCYICFHEFTSSSDVPMTDVFPEVFEAEEPPAFTAPSAKASPEHRFIRIEIPLEAVQNAACLAVPSG